MKKLLSILLALFLVPAVALAYGHSHGNSGQTNHQHHSGGSHNGGNGGGGNNGGGNPVPTPPPSPTPVPVPPPAPPPPISGESRFIAYTTGYGYPDNTPPSAEISNPVIHPSASGTGTFADPITVAVGHSIISGKDILDYPAGTRFYIPNLRRYFVVEDTCGDGNSPQNGPCHTGYQGHPWIDLWVGGSIAQSNATLSCEDTITDLHLVIENPASNYVVVPVPVFFGSCTAQFGDTILTQ